MEKIANIKDIKRLVKKIKDDFSLCGFRQHHEGNILVAQTMHAAVLNHKKRGEPFSFNEIKVSTRLCDNFAAFDSLVEDGFFTTGKREKRPVIFPTQKLIEALDNYFDKE